jgi:hypothetical protein
MTTKNYSAIKTKKEKYQPLDGVVIGVLVGINNGIPQVVYPANPQETAIQAKATTVLNTEDIGKEVALLFEAGDPAQPMIIGRIQQPAKPKQAQQDDKATFLDADIDGEHITLTGKHSITLKCGSASITLTKAGKILIRGKYLLSRSSGANCIKGGSVQIN